MSANYGLREANRDANRIAREAMEAKRLTVLALSLCDFLTRNSTTGNALNISSAEHDAIVAGCNVITDRAMRATAALLP